MPSGADLANLINEAALTAVRSDSDSVRAEDLEVARDRILMGQKRDSLALTNDERPIALMKQGTLYVLHYCQILTPCIR